MRYLRFSTDVTGPLIPFFTALEGAGGLLLASADGRLEFALPDASATQLPFALANAVVMTEPCQLKHEPRLSARLVIQGPLDWPVLTALAESLLRVQPALSARVLHDDEAGSVIVFETVPEVNAIVPELLAIATSFQVDLQWADALPTLNRPGLLVMDMDSTAIQIECIDEIAKLAGVGTQVAEITEQAMQGLLDFSQSLRARVATLKGADEQILAEVRRHLPLMPGLSFLVDKLRQHQWKVAIASGGFTYFADYLKEQLPLDAAVSNVFGIEQGTLTGEVVGQIVDANVKAHTLTTLAQEWGIDPAQTVAVGDGANDLKMMSAAALGVAFHAKPIVNQQADCAIRYGGLEQIFYLLKSV